MLSFRQFSLLEELLSPATSLGFSREEMPQIAADDISSFMKFLEGHEVKFQSETVLASSLKPTQSEINGERVRAMKSDRTEKKPMIVSHDGFILDGHHRWMRAVWDRGYLKIIRVSINILPLIELAKAFPKSFYKHIDHKMAA